MKHLKALSKTQPSMAFSIGGKTLKETSPCDTILKTPEEKADKKGTA